MNDKGSSSNRTPSDHVIKAIERLSPLQRRIMFALGAVLGVLVLVRYFVQDILRPHEHQSVMVMAFELGGSVVMLVFAISLMAPPFGMWLIQKLPLPKFLSRKGTQPTTKE